MCNRYAQRGSVSDIRQLSLDFGMELVTTSTTDNLQALDNIYADQDAPILRRREDGKLELEMMRWGFPGIPRKSQKTGKPLKPQPITNIRNLKSTWWQNTNREFIIDARYRALIPFTSFSEPHDKTKEWYWFYLTGIEVAFFAGFWRPWYGKRLDTIQGKTKRQDVQQDWELFAFLTSEPNGVVSPIHGKAMPAILHKPSDCLRWLSGGVETLDLQRSLADEYLSVASRE